MYLYLSAKFDAFTINPTIFTTICWTICAHFMRVKDEEHPNNLTSHLYTFTKVMHRIHITIVFCTISIFLGYAIQSVTKLVN